MHSNVHFKFRKPAKSPESNIKYPGIVRWFIAFGALMVIGFGCRKDNPVKKDLPEHESYGRFASEKVVELAFLTDTIVGEQEKFEATGSRQRVKGSLKRQIATFNIKSKEPKILPIDRKRLEVIMVEERKDRVTKIDSIAPQLISQPIPIKALPMRFKDAAQFNIQYLDVEQGISSSFIYSIYEDKKGNLWFGTYGGGLCRYDGKNIHNYTDIQGLSNNRIRVVTEDEEGNLWIATNGGGVIKYNGQHFINYSVKNGLENNRIYELYTDKKGRLWFGFANGSVSRFDGDSFFTLREIDGLTGDRIYAIMEDQGGNMWFGTDGGGIAIYDGENITRLTTKDGLPNDQIRDIIEDDYGDIWIATNGGGLCKFDSKTLSLYGEKQGLPNGKILTMILDEQGSFWLGTYGGGAIKFDGQQFSHYTETDGLSHNTVLSILEDRSNNIWFGTNGGGVSKLKENSFNSYLGKEVLENSTVRSIIEDRRGNIWFCTDGKGVTKFDGEVYETYNEDLGLPNGNIYCMLEDRNGTFWFGTRGAGVFSFDGKQFTTYTESDGLALNNVRCMYEDINGNLWFGTYGGGVSKFDGKYFSNITEEDGLGRNVIRSIYEDKKGNLWFGTDGGGVSKYDGKKLVNYTEKSGLPSNIVMTIYEDKNNNMWFGTWGGGLSRFDGKKFEHFTKESGLSHDLVLSIIEDRKQNIWVGTEAGINVLQPSGTNGDYNCVSMTKWDGLKRLDLALNSVCLDRNNQIWWGLGKGITKLDLNSFAVSGKQPEVQLDYVEINQEFVDFRQIADTECDECDQAHFSKESTIIPFYNYPKDLQLPHHLNHITFHFSAIDWAAPHKLKYQYRFNGFDKSWSQLQPDGVAEYRNIPSGNYVFDFRAIGESNIYSRTLSYPVEIVAPWYESIWAQLLGVLLIVAIVFGIFRWRIRQLSRNQIILRNIVNERTKELMALTEEMKFANKELTEKNEQISSQSEKLNLANEALNTVNTNLERMVKERTRELTNKNKILSDFAFMNAHNLRVPVANIKGIIQLFEFKLTMEEKEELIERLKGQSDDLDQALIDITNRLEKDETSKADQD